MRRRKSDVDFQYIHSAAFHEQLTFEPPAIAAELWNSVSYVVRNRIFDEIGSTMRIGWWRIVREFLQGSNWGIVYGWL
ncbi:hypothetical protein CEXT_414981 [Caerostris extrusa]|uniref:Uncharacterized protein n=1 Tax=Caerostris extrusa TaxID=172846 RepID=A0AAV4N204_CAEEX|nr:hypothetical protein CEXT_414981 [Caerostris extrusa]